MKRIISIVLFLCMTLSLVGCSKGFDLKNTGKYVNYIDAVKTNRLKEVKKEKPIENTYQIVYENVIFEKEISKKELLEIKNDANIAEYLVLLIDKYEVKNGENIEKKSDASLYLCKVTKNNFRQIIKSQLTEDSNLMENIKDVAKAGGIGAGTAGAVGAAVGTVVPGAGNLIGGSIGSIGGFVIGAGNEIFNKYKKGESDLDDLIKEIPDDVFAESFNDYAKLYDPSITKLNLTQVEAYLSNDAISGLNSLIKKYTK